MKGSKLIIICGLPGSGKSTLAKELKVKFNAVSLVPDEWMIKLFGYNNDPKDRDNVEKLQLELAIELVNKGINVILENGFWSASERLSLIKKASLRGVSVEAYFLLIDDDKRELRISKRNKSLGEYEYKMDQAAIKYCRGRFEKPNDNELGKYLSYLVAQFET